MAVQSDETVPEGAGGSTRNRHDGCAAPCVAMASFWFDRS